MACLFLTFTPEDHFYIVVKFSTSHTNNELPLRRRNLNFCTVVICTEKTKRYKNQIDLSKLSDPKLIDKKRCHSVTKNVTALRCLFSFFIWIVRAREKLFLRLESLFHALPSCFQQCFNWRPSFAENWKMSQSVWKLSDLLRHSVTWLKTICVN